MDTFLYQTQSYVVLFVIISFVVYKYMVTKQKRGISIHNRVTFNSSLEKLSISIVDIINIYKSSHEDGVVIFITCSKLGINK